MPDHRSPAVPARDLPGSVQFWTFLVALAAIALYLPAIGFDLVYDSNPQILIDNFIHQPRHLLDVLTLRVMGMDVLDFNRPVNLFTLLVDSLLWGKNPAGYHFTSILLHGATAAVLFRWLRGLVGMTWPALAAALLFAAHPLHIETVVEVGYREDLLATLFMLAGLLCATKFRPESPGRLRNTWLPATGTVVCLALSVASKETGVAGPAALGVYWLLLRRDDKWRPWATLILATGLVATAFMTVRFALEPKHSIIFDSEPGRLAPTWGGLIAIQCRIFTGEFLRIVWPAELCADYNGYSVRDILLFDACLALILLVGAQAFLCVFGPQRRLFILGTAIFWFSLAPVSNVIPIFRPMADRFMYMPLAGVALMLAAAMASGAKPTARLAPWPQAAVMALALAATAALSWRTWHESQNWRDEQSLWSVTTARNPMSFNGWLGVGYALLDKNEPLGALTAFERASALAHGNRAEPLAGLALTAAALHRQSDAARCLATAAQLDRRYAKPDLLLQALILEPARVQRLKAIAAWAAKHSNPAH